MGFGDLPKTDTSDRNFDVDVPFSEMVHDIFTDSASARLGRMLPVNQRTAQKWIANSGGMPEDVYRTVEHQYALYQKNYPRAKFLKLIFELKELGIHEEVIASELATIYGDMMGHKPR